MQHSSPFNYFQVLSEVDSGAYSEAWGDSQAPPEPEQAAEEEIIEVKADEGENKEKDTESHRQKYGNRYRGRKYDPDYKIKKQLREMQNIEAFHLDRPLGPDWDHCRFGNMLEDAIETSQNGQEALKKLDSYIQHSKFNDEIPDHLDIVETICELTAKYPDGRRKAIETGGKMIFSKLFAPKTFISKPIFFPSEENEKEVIKFLKYAKKYIYCAIYTVTNDRLANVLYMLQAKGVDVRVLTDDETKGSKGCNIQELANCGISVRTDTSESSRMHHKFIVVDDELLINGSFNWTWTAVKYNNENLVVTSDDGLIKSFKGEFLRLWEMYESAQVSPDGEPPRIFEKMQEKFKDENDVNIRQSRVSYKAWDDINEKLDDTDFPKLN